MDRAADSAAPLYIQVAGRVRQEIDRGSFAPGGWLPSEPALARTFGISRGTLRQALAALARQGVVETVPGRGTLVRGGAPPAAAA